MFQADQNIARASKKCGKPTSGICICHTWVSGVESEDKRLAKKSDARSLIQLKPPAFHMMSIQAIMCQTALWSCRASLRCGEVIQSHTKMASI